MNSLRLYFSTVCHLKSAQLFYLARQRLLPTPTVSISRHTLIQLRKDIRLDATVAPKVMRCGDYTFCFLNDSRSFPAPFIDWVCADMPKLWRYNLHYFDFLHDCSRSKESLANIVTDWIDKNPVGVEDAWEPYTVSLRIVNWVKWFLRSDTRSMLRKEWLQSLYLQTAWLEKNIERHLLANHYLKNAKALFFAGVFFEGAAADRWFRKGLSILGREAFEQILPDGGHYERSPMYHCIVVEDFLDVLNLALSNTDIVNAGEIGLLRERVVASLDFLDTILMPGGQIPLFNDSAFGIAPDGQQLFDYAQRIIGYRRPERDAGLRISERADSGYYVIRDSDDMLVVDCGPIGPDYQPGHAHCDTLSYELYLNGRPVVVDSGVHDYENSDDRRYARSSRAHNTVVVDEHEQSEVWGTFRVGRRAKPIQVRLEKKGGVCAVFEGAHDGYRRLPGRVIHRRVIEYERGKGWRVSDELIGSGSHYVESYIHFAAGLQIRNISDELLEVFESSSGDSVAEIALPDDFQVEILRGKYFPEFGVSIENQVVKMYGEASLPFQSGYGIRDTGCAEPGAGK